MDTGEDLDRTTIKIYLYKKMRLSISVMAHPKRGEFFPYLTENLGDVPFAIDFESKGEWENAKRAWMMYDKDADWHVVIQDDAIICKDFKQQASEVIKQAKITLDRDNYVVNFYYGYRRSSEKQASESLQKGFWVNAYPKWGVAICMQTKYIEQMIKYGDALEEDHTRDDARIGAFIGHMKLPVYFPMPSLIDHRHGESLVGDPGEKRSAYKFIDN